MKRALLSIIFIFFLIPTLVAQNWSLASDGEDYFFDSNTGFKLDSLTTQNSDSIYYTSKQLVYESRTQFRICLTLAETSFGLSYQRKLGETIITTLNGDSLHFPDFSSILNNWRLLTLSSGAYYEGTMLLRDTISFKGAIDSVQYYKISFYDSSGTLNSSVLGDTLSLLKQSGQLSTYAWTNFSDSTALLFEQLPKDLLSKREVYNFDVGDEIHYTIYHDHFNPTDYKNIEILSKSLTSDSVTYIVDVDFEDNYYDIITFQLATSYHSYRDTITYNNLDFKVGGLPNHLNPKYGGEDFDVSNSNMTNREGYTYLLGGIHYDTTNNRYCKNTRSGLERTYVVGLGSLDYSYSYFGSGGVYFDRETITYYKKGNYSWGTPNIITGIDKQQQDIQVPWFYPNPAKERIQLESSLSINELRIYNNKGQLVKEFYNPNQSIKLTQLLNGLYIIEAVDVNGQIKRNKLLIQR